MCRGGNQNTFKLKVKQIHEKKKFGAQLCIRYSFALVWCVLNEK